MADMVPQGTQLEGVPHGHESADANMRSVFVAVAVILSSTLVVMLAMAGMFQYLNNREKLKDIGVPDAFAVRQLPPGPPLLPSPKRDELPWGAYQNERRAQEAEAAKYGIINKYTGAYQVPRPVPQRQLSREEIAQERVRVAQETEQYFKSKPQWEQFANQYTRDSAGGNGIESSKQRFGHNGTSAPQAYRPGENREVRELGPKQISE